MAAVSELPADEPLPLDVEPVLELDLDLASWASGRKFEGTRGSVGGLGTYFGVELLIYGEVVVLLAFDDHPTPGQVICYVSPELPERERRAVQLLGDLGLTGTCTGTETGIVHSL